DVLHHSNRIVCNIWRDDVQRHLADGGDYHGCGCRSGFQVYAAWWNSGRAARHRRVSLVAADRHEHKTSYGRQFPSLLMLFAIFALSDALMSGRRGLLMAFGLWTIAAVLTKESAATLVIVAPTVIIVTRGKRCLYGKTPGVSSSAVASRPLWCCCSM